MKDEDSLVFGSNETNPLSSVLGPSTEALYHELMPVSVRSGVSGTRIIWIKSGDAILAEPFYHQTLARLQARMPPCVSTSLEWLIGQGGDATFRKPAGFIFHMSRCGSTLVCNALKISEDVIVVAEAAPVLELLTPSPPSMLPYPVMRWDEVRWKTLEGILMALRSRSLGENPRLIVKFASWNATVLRLIRAWCPDVPCLIVIRDPLEVAVSNLSANSGWMAFYGSPDKLKRFFGWEFLDAPTVSREDYCARLLGHLCTSMLRTDLTKCRVIDYDQLNPERLIAIRGFFGLQTTCEDEALITSICATYSKDPMRSTPHVDDRAEKQRRASFMLREAVRTHALSSYLQIRSLAV
jgi:hypothetical protein